MRHSAIATTNSYDLLQYPSRAFADTHPARMATVATLFGMDPPPVSTSRVLELGCASGGNLIPLASALPEASFLGLDFSQRQVRCGQRSIAALGLTNIELRDEDILDLDPASGLFDYIICHGVYSWVDQPVRAKILDICRQHLVPNGVAYVSYNTFPGWHARTAIRDLLEQFTRQATDVVERVGMARELLRRMEAAAPAGSGQRAELQELAEKSDAYLYHEYLEAVNQPFYFEQFAHQAADAGLQFLGEARLADMWTGNLPPEARKFVDGCGSDLIAQQQGLDFVLNRTFRRTLLCHDDVTLKRTVQSSRLAGLHLAAHIRPERRPDTWATSDVVTFRTPAGETISASGPLTKAALAVLGENWPRAVQFEQLLSLAALKLGQVEPAVPDSRHEKVAPRIDETVGGQLLQAHAAGVVDIVAAPFGCVSVSPSGRPLASPAARREALLGEQVTNLQHHSIVLGPFEREVLMRLDGQHDRAAIVAELLQFAATGRLTIEGENGTDEGSLARQRATLAAAVERSIVRLTELALLDASSI